jgi:hypothetical protein
MNRFFLKRVFYSSFPGDYLLLKHCPTFLFILVCSLSFFGCKSKKKITQTEGKHEIIAHNDTINEKCHLDYKSGKVLTKYVKENELDFIFANAKFNCDLSIDSEEHSFNVSVRCRKDSVIWMTISKLGIDAARVLITKDSVKFTMGLTEKKYFKGDFTYINQLLHADLDFDMIQALLFGNSAQFYEQEEKLRPGKDRKNCMYFLSTIRKRHVRRITSGLEQPKESYQTIWIGATSFKIMLLEFEDIETKRKFNALYDDFRAVDKFIAPFKMIYTITAEKIIKANISFGKININEPQKFPFNIPPSYDPIEIKKQQ